MHTASNRFSFAMAVMALAACGTSLSARAADKADAESLVTKSRLTIEALARDASFAPLKASLAQARAVLIFPQVLKAGFFLGGAGGSGVLMARDAATGQWSGPAFYTMGSASIGLQAGASSAEMVMVVHSQKALESLYANKLQLGSDATAALGTKGVEKSAGLDADFVVYAKVKGAFAGVSVDGSVLDVRQQLNAAYYGQAATPLDILVRQRVRNPDATRLQTTMADLAK
jgi:lipid-binding SYLF domain-containing protein